MLAGDLTFHCGDDAFELSDGGFIFLPRGIMHGYRIRSENDVRLLAVTAPAQEDAAGGWGGFVADFEAQGELRGSPRCSVQLRQSSSASIVRLASAASMPPISAANAVGYLEH